VKIIGEWLHKRDAKALAHWWNANTKGYYEIQKQGTDSRSKKFWKVIRIDN